jgi:shikimate kinase
MEHDAEILSPTAIAALARRLDRPVVLVGLMGVGKSTVGRKLAAALRFTFVDADEEIEAAAQMSISEIFDQFGEPYFRDGERRVIARLIGDDGINARQVIATGGGAFVNPETRALILERAIAVWLDADLDTLVDRVVRKDNRPLLRDADPYEVLGRLKAERASAYAEAPIHVISDGGPQQRTVNRILAELAQWP